MEEFDYIKYWLLKGVIVYCFKKKGKCPNCNRDLVENQFGNWECRYCWDQSLWHHKDYVLKLLKKWGLID
ncbi:hypothetical protein LCGC14_0371540 [marine sediment metagenome]|uniref:Uncharacterized protein n=1 Tax=marine sediment metagenome TaxID=412755 RepID=A0A0F9TN03_9ZZZZ